MLFITQLCIGVVFGRNLGLLETDLLTLNNSDLDLEIPLLKTIQTIENLEEEVLTRTTRNYALQQYQNMKSRHQSHKNLVRLLRSIRGSSDDESEISSRPFKDNQRIRKSVRF